MAETALTQSEADGLIAVEKVRADALPYDYPGMGGLIVVRLSSPDRREQFLLDVRRGRIDLTKLTHQNRARQVIVLVRLDLGGPPHRNPDDTEIPCPHLHRYREGYADKWATAVPESEFLDLHDLWRTLEDFMRYCNVTMEPAIGRGLFL
ncbi:MAG TPA: hypothetical protein VFC78_23630 [Tepidisphaeraceae bacterium]|nr:hypothetical protein [Tepidisphaeraceae bacterium]